ncbi:hypothetical protein JCM10207_007609 [Rhodosporidiobolus poonsookiae]
MGLFKRSSRAATPATGAAPSPPSSPAPPSPGTDRNGADKAADAAKVPLSPHIALPDFAPISAPLPKTHSADPASTTPPTDLVAASSHASADEAAAESPDASSESDDEFDDAASGAESDFEAAVEPTIAQLSLAEAKEAEATTGARDRGEMSKAARLVAEKMEEDVKPEAKLGKTLASLTAEDVALTEADIRTDMAVVWKAMHLFLSSRMKEAEDICLCASDHRMYYSLGFALIQSIKSLATFEPDDLEAAIQCCRNAAHVAHLLRKRDNGLLERAKGIATGTISVSTVRSMSVVQRHAELVHAEATLLKAVLGIIYSGDYVAFLKEALNMRSAYATYRTLDKYVEGVDAAYTGPGYEDPSIDQDFRSGVCVGNGMISLILSLLPSAVIKVMDLFGFSGDRDWALQTLMKPGRWRAGLKEPGIEPENEGIRRPIADMVLLMYHLVISNYLPVGGVDIITASHILHYNLDRYPSGIFFLYFGGRLNSTETVLDEAKKSFRLAIEAQREFAQLAYICLWDLGLVGLAEGDWKGAFECYDTLYKESNWSKAVYSYARAVTLYEQGLEPDTVDSLMRDVPNLLQRVASKTIPIEKFMSRRAKKFIAQGNRLCLPGVELAYVLNCLSLSPRFILTDRHLAQVDKVLAELSGVKVPAEYGKNGDEFWDDYCLAHLLRGRILSFIAHPEPFVVPRPAESPIPIVEADEQALLSFNNVLKHGKDIQTDHHLVWFAHYELGRLHHARGDWTKARSEYETVMSGKIPELSTKKSKGKVSLQNMAVLRSNSGLQLLKERGH